MKSSEIKTKQKGSICSLRVVDCCFLHFCVRIVKLKSQRQILDTELMSSTGNGSRRPKGTKRRRSTRDALTDALNRCLINTGCLHEDTKPPDND